MSLVCYGRQLTGSGSDSFVMSYFKAITIGGVDIELSVSVSILCDVVYLTKLVSRWLVVWDLEDIG